MGLEIFYLRQGIIHTRPVTLLVIGFPIDKYLGTGYRWIPALGNHDISDGSEAGLIYLRNEWNGDNPGQANREAIRDYAEPGSMDVLVLNFISFIKG